MSLSCLLRQINIEYMSLRQRRVCFAFLIRICIAPGPRAQRLGAFRLYGCDET